MGVPAVQRPPHDARLASFSEGEAVLEVPIRNELLQQGGFVHGGVISYAADNALTFAGSSVLGPTVPTSEYKINYLRPASGETLVARTSVVQRISAEILEALGGALTILDVGAGAGSDEPCDRAVKAVEPSETLW